MPEQGHRSDHVITYLHTNYFIHAERYRYDESLRKKRQCIPRRVISWPVDLPLAV